MLPTVVIVGRPNVGKSTLFNRLIKQNKAITHDRPGVTRDRVYGTVTYADPPFDLVDTGGLVFDPPDDQKPRGPRNEDEPGFEREIMEQAREAVESADLVLFAVDGREGLTGMDELVGTYLRQSNRPTLCVVAKVDGEEQVGKATAEFHALGFDLVPVSAAHNFNVRELVFEIEQRLPKAPEGIESGDACGVEPADVKLAMLGKPNAGKSSLINAFMGEKRLIVSPVAGTTRDCVDVLLEKPGKDGEIQKFLFVDTAGVRKKTRIDDSLERFSVIRALKAAKAADVTLLVMDATVGVTLQDKKLISFLSREKTPFIAIVNKIDLIPKSEQADAKKAFQDALSLCNWAPVAYVSAVTRAGLASILPLAQKLKEECQIRVSTGKLNRVLRQATEGYQPPLVNRRRVKFYYVTQADTSPPTFVFFVNDPELVKVSYARYLEGRIRKALNLRRVPIEVLFRSSRSED